MMKIEAVWLEFLQLPALSCPTDLETAHCLSPLPSRLNGKCILSASEYSRQLRSDFAFSYFLRCVVLSIILSQSIFNISLPTYIRALAHLAEIMAAPHSLCPLLLLSGPQYL